jgi:hypothetical protein
VDDEQRMKPAIALEDLYRLVEARAPDGGPLARLRAAVETARELDELSEQLLDRFVLDARASGSSWTEIGAPLGVSKQAAQQRFTAPLTIDEGAWPERLSDAARRAVTLGAEEARAHGHPFLGTEHVLVGLLAQDGGIAARALAALEIGEAAVRDRLREVLGARGPSGKESLCVMPRLKQALELARRQADALGRDCADTEHLLLGLVQVRGALAGQILADLGAGPERVRAQLASMLGVDAADLVAPADRRRRRLRRLARIPS